MIKSNKDANIINLNISHSLDEIKSFPIWNELCFDEQPTWSQIMSVVKKGLEQELSIEWTKVINDSDNSYPKIPSMIAFTTSIYGEDGNSEWKISTNISAPYNNGTGEWLVFSVEDSVVTVRYKKAYFIEGEDSGYDEEEFTLTDEQKNELKQFMKDNGYEYLVKEW